MKLISKFDLNSYNKDDYIWYACYGSNINYERFIYYIKGDKTGKYSTLKGCSDKTLPLEERPYIFRHPIYFAGHSKTWNGGGIAFLDYEHSGKSYGKIYKIKMCQFIDILAQEERCKLYNAILLVDYIEDLPIFTFTAQHKLYKLLQEPNTQYIETIKKGLLSIYDELDEAQLDEYFKFTKH